MTPSFSRFRVISAETIGALVERLNECHDTFNVITTFKEHDVWHVVLDCMPTLVMVDDTTLYEDELYEDERYDPSITHTLSA